MTDESVIFWKCMCDDWIEEANVCLRCGKAIESNPSSARVFVPAGSGESRVEYRVVDREGSPRWTYTDKKVAVRFLASLDADWPAYAPHRIEKRTITSGPWTTEGDKPSLLADVKKAAYDAKVREMTEGDK